MKAAFCMVSLLLVACSANPTIDAVPTQETNTVSSTVADDKIADNDDVRCSQVKKTGSNLRKRLCMTKEQQEEAREASEESLRKLKTRGTGLPVRN